MVVGERDAVVGEGDAAVGEGDAVVGEGYAAVGKGDVGLFGQAQLPVWSFLGVRPCHHQHYGDILNLKTYYYEMQYFSALFISFVTSKSVS